jgi:hypothetical protein
MMPASAFGSSFKKFQQWQNNLVRMMASVQSNWTLVELDQTLDSLLGHPLLSISPW